MLPCFRLSGFHRKVVHNKKTCVLTYSEKILKMHEMCKISMKEYSKAETTFNKLKFCFLHHVRSKD